MNKSVYGYEQMIESELKDVIAEKCPEADSDYIFLIGVEENIALWRYRLFSYGGQEKNIIEGVIRI